MEEKLAAETGDITNIVISIGIDLTLIESLVKVIDCGLCEDCEISDVDISNIAIILKRMLAIVKSKYDNLEHCLNT